MQFDFFQKLLFPARAEKPNRPRKPIPSGSGVDELLTGQSREWLRSLDCDRLAARVRVRWNPRMRSTAGTANYLKSLVTLNPRLREISEEEVIRTLKHELAHLVAQHRAGLHRIAPHGIAWKRACADLGLAGETRCHRLPLPRRQFALKHVYRCPVCRTEIRRVRPFRRCVACLACCRAHNRGHFDERFRLVKTRAR